MLVNDKEIFDEIVDGNKTAYFRYLWRDNRASYQIFFQYICQQQSLEKCNWYALYDFTHCLMNQISISKDKQKVLALEFIEKLNSFAEKNKNFAAQCCIMILNNHYGFENKNSQSLLSLKRAALQNILNKKSSELKIWSNLLLAIHAQLIDKLDKDVASKYLQEKNPVIIHYYACHFTKDFLSSNKILNLLDKNSQQKCSDDPYLLCLIFGFVEIYMKESPKFLPPQKNDFGHNTYEMINKCKDFSPVQASYFLGLHYVRYQSYGQALTQFGQAKEMGHPDAQARIDEINNKEFGKISNNIINLNSDIKIERKQNRDFLFRKGSGYIIKVHGDLEVTSCKNNRGDYQQINADLFVAIKNVIETNTEVSALVIENVQYFANFSELVLATAKAKTIHTLVINNAKILLKDYLQILHFVATNSHLKHIKFNECSVCYELGMLVIFDDKKNNLYLNLNIDFLKKIKHLETCIISGDFEDEDIVDKLLLNIKFNEFLYKTKTGINSCSFTNDNLIQLANLFNSGISSLEIICDESEFDNKGIVQFTKDIEHNTTLKNLYLKRFLQTRNDIKNEKVYKFFETLITKTKIESLALVDSLCLYENVSVKFIASYVRKSQSLRSLDLSSNGLNDADFQQISYVFRYQNLLESLSLNTNIYTQNGVEYLADALNNYPNSLKKLDLQNVDTYNEDQDKINPTVIEVNKLYRAFAKLISGDFFKVEELYLPVIIGKDIDDKLGFNEFIAALTKNKTIRKLKFSGRLADDKLALLFELAKNNQNICRISYFNSEVSNLASQKLQDQLLLNAHKLEASRSEEIKEEPKVVVKNLEKQSPKPKATRQTLEQILKKIMVEYLIIEQDKNLVLQFPNSDIALQAAAKFNHLKSLANIKENSLIFINYYELDEADIKSVEFLLTNFGKVEQSYRDKLNLYDILLDIKRISCRIQDQDLCLNLKSSNKITKDVHSNILHSIIELLQAKNIVCRLEGNRIVISNYKDIPEENIAKLTSNIKSIIKQNIQSYALKGAKSSYNIIADKIAAKKTDKVKKKEVKESAPLASRVESLPSPSTIEESVADSAVNTAPVIELIASTQIFSELPTERRFRDLATCLLSDTNNSDKKFNSLMKLIFMHHVSLLKSHPMIEDKLKYAYYILYHAIRISELTNNYMKNFNAEDKNLQLSAYGIRNIMADRPDYFLPTSAADTISLLESDPFSFLTINRQILLELFDDSQKLKIKLPFGLTNIKFFKVFYKSDLSDLHEKLYLPHSLTHDLSYVLKNMKQVIEVIDGCLHEVSDISELFSTNALANVNLCIIKSAVFLLGHFSRILREHHNNFFTIHFNNFIASGNYNATVKTILGNILGDSIVCGGENFIFLEYIEKLNEECLLGVANEISFIDYCIIFIEARNMIGHTQQDNPLIKPEEAIIFEDIPSKTFAALCQYFIKNSNLLDCLNAVLKIANELEDDSELDSMRPSSIRIT